MASVFGNTGVIVLADLTCEPFKIPVQTNSTNLITSFMKKMTTGEAQEDPGGFQWWLLDSALTGQTGSHHLLPPALRRDPGYSGFGSNE